MYIHQYKRVHPVVSGSEMTWFACCPSLMGQKATKGHLHSLTYVHMYMYLHIYACCKSVQFSMATHHTESRLKLFNRQTSVEQQTRLLLLLL